jgi:hypothetical protein
MLNHFATKKKRNSQKYALVFPKTQKVYKLKIVIIIYILKVYKLLEWQGPLFRVQLADTVSIYLEAPSTIFTPFFKKKKKI